MEIVLDIEELNRLEESAYFLRRNRVNVVGKALSFSGKDMRKFKEKYKYCNIYCNSIENWLVVTFSFVNEKDENSFKLIRYKGTTFAIGCSRLISKYGLKNKEPTKIEVYNDKIIVIWKIGV